MTYASSSLFFAGRGMTVPEIEITGHTGLRAAPINFTCSLLSLLSRPHHRPLSIAPRCSAISPPPIAQGLWAPRTEAITETRGSLTSLRNEEPRPDGTRANGAPPRLPFANMTGHSSTQPTTTTTTTTTHNSQLTSRPSTVLPAMPPASLVGNPSDRGPRSSDLD